jgi:hypothetical protein
MNNMLGEFKTAADAAKSAADTAGASLEETRKSNRITGAAMGISGKQLERMDRPYVVLADLSLSEPVQMRVEGMAFSILLTLKNEGRSPAHSVTSKAGIAFEKGESLDQEVAGYCDFADKSTATHPGDIIFSPASRSKDGTTKPLAKRESEPISFGSVRSSRPQRVNFLSRFFWVV